MDKLSPKKYLQQVYNCNIVIEFKIREINYLRELAQKVTPVISEDKVQTGFNGDKLGDTIAKLVDIESQINAQIDKYIEIRDEVNRMIDTLENADQRLILRLRYLEFMSWDCIETSYPYSRSTIFRLHKQGLKELRKLLDN